jgi:hypothetical protein
MGVEPFFRDALSIDLRARAVCHSTRTGESGCGTSAEVANVIVRDVLAMGRAASLAHYDSRERSRSRDMRLVMQLLAMRDIPRGAIRRMSESAEIPTGAMRRWRGELHERPNWRPSGFSAHPPSGALNAQQELDLPERLRVE